MPLFALYLVACWSVIALLMMGTFPGATLLVVAAAVYTALPIFAFIARRSWAFYPNAAFRVLVVRVLLYTQLLLPFVAGAGLLGTIVGAPFGHARSSGQVTALVVFAAASVLLAAGYFGSQSLVVREVDVSIPSLPAEFDGLRIVQLSDTHIGPHIPARFLERVVRTVRTLEPDLIAVTGDLIDDRAEDVAVYAKALGSLSAPDGVFMIPGNHDVYAGWDAVARNLRASINGHVLVNEAHVIRRGHAALTIVGTGDPAGVQRGLGANVAPDIARAYATVDDNSVVIALAHNPSLWPALAKRGAALTLSGHTHWGQFAVPHRNWSLASRFQPHAMGVHTDGDSMLYISPGTGYWGIPFRIGARPEVTLVRLRRATSTDIQMGEARRAA